VIEQILEARVGLLGSAEAGEHTHRPELAAVAGRVDAASKRIFAGVSDLTQILILGQVERCIEALDRRAGSGHKRPIALGCALERRPERLLLPALVGVAYRLLWLEHRRPPHG
jgi:hypothetical protein